ncbi:unnamed protein product, partial [Prorocentrum cordatum]
RRWPAGSVRAAAAVRAWAAARPREAAPDGGSAPCTRAWLMADAQGPPGEQLAEQIEEAPAWAGGLGGEPPQYGGGGEGGAAAAAPVEPLGEHAAADVSGRLGCARGGAGR